MQKLISYRSTINYYLHCSNKIKCCKDKNDVYLYFWSSIITPEYICDANIEPFKNLKIILKNGQFVVDNETMIVASECTSNINHIQFLHKTCSGDFYYSLHICLDKIAREVSEEDLSKIWYVECISHGSDERN